MGLLSEGTPLSWDDTKQHREHIRRQGVAQFVTLYNKFKDEKYAEFLWGDEVEYMIVKLDPETKTSRLCLKATEILNKLQKAQTEHPSGCGSLWSPEYGSYMLESSPGNPYGDVIKWAKTVEDNMAQRRREIQALLDENEYPLSITSFPRNGCGIFTEPPFVATPHAGYSQSMFFPDEAIQQIHPRFKTLLTQNIRDRRGGNVAINIPIFQDKHAPKPFVEDLSSYKHNDDCNKVAKPDHIYMDSPGFGIGQCCIQATFQLSCLEEAMMIHDQLVALSPIMIALSAATPVYRGYLSDLDTRLLAASQSLDDRTEEERGDTPLKENRFAFGKSRYDSNDSYLRNLDCNDRNMDYDEGVYTKLISEGIEDQLARHMAHVFMRDPIMVIQEYLSRSDSENTVHLDNSLTTNWMYVKLKPHSETLKAGWRVEFRPMEIQLTDFENAAYAVFVALLVQAIVKLRVNLTVPISRLEQNMDMSYKRDAVRNSKFWFRVHGLTEDNINNKQRPRSMEQSLVKLSIDQIINGKRDGGFPGLISLVEQYMNQEQPCNDVRSTIQRYLALISGRASGKFKTTARWMRDFLTSNAGYRHDSVVSEEMAYDLMLETARIMEDKTSVPDLLPEYSNSRK